MIAVLLLGLSLSTTVITLHNFYLPPLCLPYCPELSGKKSRGGEKCTMYRVTLSLVRLYACQVYTIDLPRHVKRLSAMCHSAHVSPTCNNANRLLTSSSGVVKDCVSIVSCLGTVHPSRQIR